MENKFINRYNMFCRCLENLKKSQKADPEADFVLEGTVHKGVRTIFGPNVERC